MLVLGCLWGNWLSKISSLNLQSNFCASIIMCPSHNFVNSQHLSNSTKLQTKGLTGSSEQQWKWGYKSCKNPIPICISWDASMECLLTACYWVVWGSRSKKKERVVTGSLGQWVNCATPTAWLQLVSRRSIRASRLMPIGTGFLRDL